jgi:tetratricopeptide (TPR) repeat protein
MALTSAHQNLSSKKRWIVLSTLVVLTFWVYWPVTNFEFVNFDDPLYVTKNRNVLAGITLAGIKWAFTQFNSTGNWHPLTWLSHMVDCQLSLNPGAHHFTNLLFHVANTALLFALLTTATGALWRSAMVAALFAWHPLHVESVAWVSERKDVLSTFFGLLSLLWYLGYTQRLALGGRKAKASYTLSFLAFGIGLMCKPMLVTLPCLLLLLDVWPLRRLEVSLPRNGDRSVRRLFLEKVPFIILTSISCVITFMAQKAGGTVANLESVSISSRLLNSLLSYGGYLGKIFWPINLSVFYPYRTQFPIAEIVFAIILLIGIALLAIFAFRRSSYLLIGYLWFLGTLVPVIGLIQVGEQAMADRYSYIPSIGIFIAVVWGIAAFWRARGLHPTALGVVATTILLLCFSATSIQLGAWRNSLTLFDHALKVWEPNALAHHNLGEELSQRGNQREAIIHYTRAISLRPNYPSAYLNLGNSLNLQGDAESAIRHYLKAIEQQPDYAKAHYALATSFATQKRISEAEAHFKAAIKSSPTYVEAHIDLGNLLFTQNRREEAIAHLTEAVRLEPSSSDAQYSLAYALALTKNISGAIEHYRMALKVTPRNPVALNDLAWILATEKNDSGMSAQDAIQMAKLACDLTKNHQVRYLHTLAYSYAAARQLDQALIWERKALDLAVASNDSTTARILTQQLEAWQNAEKSAK